MSDAPHDDQDLTEDGSTDVSTPGAALDAVEADRLLVALGELFAAADPPPASLIPSRSLLRWASPEAGLAELLADAPGLAGVRGPADEPDSWHFAIGSTRIEMSVEDGALAGTILPWSGGSLQVEVQADDGHPAPAARIDQDGDFFVGAVPRVPFRLRFATTDEVVVTEFVRIAG